ncbi:cilia- and flagella- associated protein 210-like [Eudromia elegans]
MAAARRGCPRAAGECGRPGPMERPGAPSACSLQTGTSCCAQDHAHALSPQQCTPLNSLAENNILDGYFLPSDVDNHQVIVLPKAEWERIQDNLGSTTREAARILAEKKERREMHLRSKAAVKDWPNTIMGLAQRKLKAKKLSKEKREEERRLIDMEEAQFQAAKRKEAIDQARTYQYYRNERVKGFHSALLLTEVLKERDAQVEFKKLKQDVNKKKEEEMEHERKKALLREEEKARERYMKQKALCRDQLEQIKEHEHQAELAKLEDKREGEEIQRLTRLYQLEIQKGKEKEQAEKLERRRLHHEHVADQKIIKAAQEQKQEEEDDQIRAHFKAKQIIAKLRKEKEVEMQRIKEHEHQAELAKLEDKREGEEIQRLTRLYQLEIQKGKEKEQAEKLERRRLHHDHIDKQKIMKLEEERKEAEEDDRIRAYIKGKEIMADLRKEKDDETTRLLQEHQDKAVQQLTAQMKEAVKMEDDRIAKGAADMEEEYQQKNKATAAKTRAEIESISEHRVSMMKMKVEREKEEKAETEKDYNQWMAADRIYMETEEAKKQKRLDENMEVQKIRVQQMAEKQARKEQEKQADLDYDAQREAAFLKEREFQR